MVSTDTPVYVMQVRSAKETETEIFIRSMIDRTLCGAAYHPTRRMLRKRYGEWREITEKLLPGYVFVETADPHALYMHLKKVPRLTKFIDRDETDIRPLPEKDRAWLSRMMQGREGQIPLDAKLRSEVGLTLVEVEETTDGRRIKILEGPLESFEGNIKKIDLHRRRAEVELEFMGQKTVLYMGIVIKE